MVARLERGDALADALHQLTATFGPRAAVVADAIGAADRYGTPLAPVLDRLALEGMRLERFYVNPICTPTRAALLTGRDARRMGVAYFPILAWSNKAVSPREHFMPETFKAAGYQTGMVGKWHLGHPLETQTPNARGFDDFFGHLHTEVKYWKHSAPAGGHDFQRNGKSVRREGRYLTDVHGDVVKPILA